MPPHAHFPQMITGVLFDVLAQLPVNYLRAPYNTSEREMAHELIKELGPPGSVAKKTVCLRKFRIFWPKGNGMGKLPGILPKLGAKLIPRLIIRP